MNHCVVDVDALESAARKELKRVRLMTFNTVYESTAKSQHKADLHDPPPSPPSPTLQISHLTQNDWLFHRLFHAL